MTSTSSATSATAVGPRHDEPPAGPGRNELGAVTLTERVVSKIVARAVTEVPEAGSAKPRILGRAVGAGVPGVRQTQLGGQPKVSVDVDLSVATVEVSISVRWPASIPAVSAAVRARIIERLDELTGLSITDVRIHVTDVVTAVAAQPRVR
ncbi:MAG: Asp23/Gls24 family envelope stress response protein [Actinomycetota bacterium]